MIQKLIIITSHIFSIFLGTLDICSCKTHTLNDNCKNIGKVHIISKKTEKDMISEMMLD